LLARVDYVRRARVAHVNEVWPSLMSVKMVSPPLAAFVMRRIGSFLA
jgi:hypothetical protein